MRILGIESSCDETAAAVVEDGTKILSNVVASSVEMHAKTGGIIPEIAAREQMKCIIPVIETAIENCKLKIENLDAIAVTIGPGLIGSLLVGIETAKSLAYLWQKPIIPINHLIGHIYANFLKTDDGRQMTDDRKTDKTEVPSSVFCPPKFPAIALVVSGGHTDLVLMKDHGNITWIGGTRDDAAGECFDKSARLLGLGYPGGPAISAAAEQWSNEALRLRSGQAMKQSAIKLPRPIMEEDNSDFSFSGLKTAVLREVQKLHNNQQYNNITIQQLSYELQEAITDVLVTKTIRATEKYQVKSILLAGGVSANQRLREKFQIKIEAKLKASQTNFKLFVPPVRLCTDSAAYIASCAFFNFKPVPWQEIKVNPGLTISDKI